ncbi:MAG: PAS domain-containing protein, partial [Thermoplasmata archaeon]|nr:PAS domain-containing protein [Thermoplasmata archaeon]
LFRVNLCAIMEYDDASREFRTVSSFALGAQRTQFDGLRVQEADIPWLAQRLITLRLPAILKPGSGEPGVPAALQKRVGLRAALVVPLAARGKFLGLMWLDDTQAAHYFTSTEINVAQGIATQIAIALDGASLADRLDLEQRRIEALATALADGLVVVDREMRMISLDGGAEALLGWQTSEIRGRRMSDVFDISEAEASLAWTKERDGPASAAKELRLRARDGRTVDCVAHGIAVRGADGEVAQILYALRKRPGSQGYADRVMDSIGELATAQAPEPPE